jgi:hypothetical protein
MWMLQKIFNPSCPMDRSERKNILIRCFGTPMKSMARHRIRNLPTRDEQRSPVQYLYCRAPGSQRRSNREREDKKNASSERKQKETLFLRCLMSSQRERELSFLHLKRKPSLTYCVAAPPLNSLTQVGRGTMPLRRQHTSRQRLTFAAAVYVIGDLQVGIALARLLGRVAVAADHPALGRALAPVAELLVSSACVNKH